MDEESVIPCSVPPSWRDVRDALAGFGFAGADDRSTGRFWKEMMLVSSYFAAIPVFFFYY
jgi:hypothetical protein